MWTVECDVCDLAGKRWKLAVGKVDFSTGSTAQRAISVGETSKLQFAALPTEALPTTNASDRTFHVSDADDTECFMKNNPFECLCFAKNNES